ncbi:hypothetical protein [Acaryochloris sp. IP29b_bin.137]|uniref:hypothetical protein n=1 Tax=Acaryochloris sp. IP29b_bin.137 TaxID=2969217 RepID=UPI002619F561|nr:hypothetical protein [Acaryochloris sp. IP29b_bin.137]
MNIDWKGRMRIVTTVVLIIVVCTLSGCGVMGRPTDGLYRLPYADGVDVEVTQDDLTHRTPAMNMFDFAGVATEQILVATAPGWVRYFEDENEVGGTANNNYIWIEHPLDYCQTSSSEAIGSTTPTTCKPCPKGLGKCNEWTLTVHMRNRSITSAPPLGAGLSLNEWVVAGQPIGIEGAVGVVFKNNMRCSDGDFAVDPLCGRHAHFNVFVFDSDVPVENQIPTVNGDYEEYAKQLSERPERVPAFCTQAGLRFVRKGEVHTAAPCPNFQ